MKNESTIAEAAGLADRLNDSSIDGIISLDKNWHINAWNRTAELMTGKARHTVLSNHLLEVLPAVKEDQETVQAITNAFKGFKAFVPASDLYGHRMQLENYYIPLFNNEGELTGVMNIVHDVAHRIKAEMQLQDLNDQLADRYRQLQRISSELAGFTMLTTNNIKAPIRTVYTAIEQLIKAESGQLSNNGKAAFRRIQASLNKMNLLLDDMLGLAQISVPEVPGKPCDLDKLVPGVIQLLQNKIKEKNVAIHLKQLCVVNGHEEQLKLLFHHLISNAIKFNEGSAPVVTINCKKAMISKVKNASSIEKEYYCVTVADDGIGIASADHEKIFNMFERLHADQRYKGSGMGLAIARKIMFAHDGFVEVESEPGKGAAFHCYFPV